MSDLVKFISITPDAEKTIAYCARFPILTIKTVKNIPNC